MNDASTRFADDQTGAASTRMSPPGSFRAVKGASERQVLIFWAPSSPRNVTSFVDCALAACDGAFNRFCDMPQQDRAADQGGAGGLTAGAIRRNPLLRPWERPRRS